MDLLTSFGLVAVSLMLVFYALEDRSAWFVLASPGRVCLPAHMAFCREHGLSV